MGLFTGQPRSADIIAHENSTAIVLKGDELKALLSGAIDMHVKVLSNVIAVLCSRVSDANALTETQSRIIRDLEKKLQESEDDYDDGDDDEYVEQE
jgi:CRP-like cAMP-binding protein